MKIHNNLKNELFRQSPVKKRGHSRRIRFVWLGFYAVSTVFQLFNGDSAQIHVSWTIFRPGNPSQGIPLPIGIVSCLFRQKCCFVCPLYIAESAKTTSFPSIYRDCLSHGVNAFLSSKLSSSKRHGIARVLQSFNN